MLFVVRVVIGAVLGLVALVATWLLGLPWWGVALASGLLAPIGFLATFFIWSADRPDLGYEQVLFDSPNSTLCILMLVVLAGASFGVTHIHFGSASAPAALGPTEAAQVELIHIATDAQKHKTDAAKGDVRIIADFLKDARAKIASLSNVTASDPALKKASDHLSAGLNALATCASGDKQACVDAQVGLGDTLSELTKYTPST